jgi:hypothetical protein
MFMLARHIYRQIIRRFISDVWRGGPDWPGHAVGSLRIVQLNGDRPWSVQQLLRCGWKQLRTFKNKKDACVFFYCYARSNHIPQTRLCGGNHDPHL